MTDLQQSCETLARLWPDIFIRDNTGAVWIPNTNIGYWPESGDEVPLTSDDVDAMLSEIGVTLFILPIEERGRLLTLEMKLFRRDKFWHREDTGVMFDSPDAQRLAKTEGFKKAIQLLAQEKEKEK